ncbi:MAG: hypothetical protein HPY61_09635 [Methanotrichaceae archaeon]|nr:hypothetical protein [Methanotrichaceae archaeon]
MKIELAAILIISALECVSGTTIEVGPGQADYTSIQAAIIDAGEGDVIQVHSGTYVENLYIDKSLTLMGMDDGKDLPVIDAGGIGSVVSLNADGITIRGLNITGSGHCGCGNAGISIQSSNDTIIGNIIYKNKYGIYIRDGKENKILFNDLIDNEISIFENHSVLPAGNASLENTTTQDIKASENTILGNHYLDFAAMDQVCSDANQDGICDFPREFGAAGSDPYPITLPWRR